MYKRIKYVEKKLSWTAVEYKSVNYEKNREKMWKEQEKTLRRMKTLLFSDYFKNSKI